MRYQCYWSLLKGTSKLIWLVKNMQDIFLDFYLISLEIIVIFKLNSTLPGVSYCVLLCSPFSSSSTATLRGIFLVQLVRRPVVLVSWCQYPASTYYHCLHPMFVLASSLLIILAAVSFRQSILAPQNRRDRLVARRRRACHSLRKESRDRRTTASGQHFFKPLAVIFTENGVNRWIESAAGAH